ncbi:VIT1/CCC1 transporter family protein [Halomonas ramblicola]|uniref:VIT1/CCC1 transporter family protein n=1 Tax=Halomonas ramblicola TaxID=747349 RepID=UPI0025B4D245|nr:VIT1/CCC1 transporter family protein [Halomonas ramblicola]MDN3520104.1 VIT1/CCC1 transporter family protein [Halomonas ramblicola]
MDDQQRRALEREHRPEAIRRRLREPAGGQSLPDAILGGIDGCVTTFAVVSGAFGAGFSATVALVLGFANLLADGFSMAISNYEAIQAQREHLEGVRRDEHRHIEAVPEGEREEIRQIFRGKGFEGEVLERVVATICSDRELWVETMLREEHGLQTSGLSPLRSGLVTFLAFLVVGAMPLLPYAVPGLATGVQFLASLAVAGLMFFLIGMGKSLVYHRPVLASGLRTLLMGGAAAGLAFLTGHLAQVLFGVGP